MGAQPSSKNSNVLIPGMIGNLLEWYDFSLYGYFASVISGLFFPTDNQTTAFIKTFGVFAVGFLMRPIGAIIFGHFGDRYGRKKTLATSVILMAVSTVIMGLLPTHAQIGIWAGMLLCACRLLQGLAVGGEFSGSIVYILEHAPLKKRGMYGSLVMFSAFAGLLLGSTVAALTGILFDQSAYAEIAWRFPFLFSIVLGGVGLYLRLRMPETPDFIRLQEAGNITRQPLLDSFREHPLNLFKATLLVFLPAMGFYLCFVYLSTYLTIYMKLSLHTALIINSISMVIILFIIPWVGHLSDKYGRRPILASGAISICLFSYPLFLFMMQGTFYAALLTQIAFAILISLCYGAIPATLAEMFSTKIRYTAMSLPYNLSNAIFGGTAPLVATYLIKITGTIMAPSFYLIFSGLIMLLVVFCIKETFEDTL
jgi:MHS family proline/betaine transporter-like MFS transporter